VNYQYFFFKSQVFFLLLGLQSGGLFFSGEVCRWTDEKGTLHFTDNESKIPGQYLGRAKRFEVWEEVATQRPEDGEMGSRCFATS
jgi:hypothetical protein